MTSESNPPPFWKIYRRARSQRPPRPAEGLAARAPVLLALLGLAVILSGCLGGDSAAASGESARGSGQVEGSQSLLPASTPLPTRPAYAPGELVAYQAQTGDNLPALAARFNTTVAEILAANPVIPSSATTLPPGLPMEIPIYYLPFWGSPYQILPDSLFVNGPAQVGFDTADFIARQPGWLNGHVEYAAGDNRQAADIVDLVALNFSISPRLLLALLEYQAGGLSNPNPDLGLRRFPLENPQADYRGLYLQLVWAANQLNDAYYQFRQGRLTRLELQDGRLERPDPWQNAATVALQAYFIKLYDVSGYTQAVSADGYASTYARLFGDPWLEDQPHLPGSLTQPQFALPFEPGKVWAYTGGPHTAWGEGEPLAALDFAPPAVIGGCEESPEWATAVAAGEVVRSETGTIVLDLDGDADERTGWSVFYFHIATQDRAPVGTRLQAGDPFGHPSCEGGRATGTHFHIARKFNGEWIPADGVLAFNLEGWVAKAGGLPYQGGLTRFGETVIACECSDRRSHIVLEKP